MKKKHISKQKNCTDWVPTQVHQFSNVKDCFKSIERSVYLQRDETLKQSGPWSGLGNKYVQGMEAVEQLNHEAV